MATNVDFSYKTRRPMERLLAGACTEMTMRDIDLSTVSIYYDLRNFNIQNKITVTSNKHKLANDLSSGTTCLIFVNRLFFKLVVTYKYDKHRCIDGLHHTMSLFTSDAMAGTLDLYFINKNMDILSFQLASAPVLASFDIVRAVSCLL